MFTRACFVLALISASACGGSDSPLNPSGSDNTAALHLSVDGATCQAQGQSLGPVTVAIDGTNVGTVNPGDNGVTKTVAVGPHMVSARSNLYNYGWSPTQVTVGAGGFTYLFYCN